MVVRNPSVMVEALIENVRAFCQVSAPSAWNCMMLTSHVYGMANHADLSYTADNKNEAHRAKRDGNSGTAIRQYIRLKAKHQ
jgi:hypothetical protein